METGDLPRALDALLDGRVPGCAPWWCWLAAALCRQRVAQTWLLEVAPTLGGEDGELPGHPGWRATFHGQGLCLEGPRGEVVDMDFGHHAGEDIDPWFFAARVGAMHEGVEAQVRRWLGSDAVLVAALGALRRDGHLWHPTSTHVFRLSAPLEAMAVRVARALDPRAPNSASGEARVELLVTAGALERRVSAKDDAARDAASGLIPSRAGAPLLVTAGALEGRVSAKDDVARDAASDVAPSRAGTPLFVTAGALEGRVSAKDDVARDAASDVAPSRAGASFSDLLSRRDEVPGEGAHAQWLAALLTDRERAPGMVPTVVSLLGREAFVRLLPGLLRSADHLAAATLEQCEALGVDATTLAAPLLAAVTDGRHPFIGVQVCRHLLRHDVETAGALAAVRALAAVVRVKGFTGNPMLDHLAFLLLEFGDELEARRVVRRALRDVPACAEAVAVVLSLLRTRWALDELRSVAADASLEGPLRRRAVVALQMAGVVAEAPAAVEHTGLGFTFDEVDAARLADQRLRVSPEHRALADRLVRLKGW